MSVHYRVATPADMAAVFRLRFEVFVLEQQVPPDLERDEFDDQAVHVVAMNDGTVVGTGRLVDETPARAGITGNTGEPGVGEPDAVAHLGRIAVAPNWRGTGVGAGLVRELEHQALALCTPGGRVRVELAAQLHALGFYEHLGYQAQGPVFLDAGIEHRQATKVIPAHR